MEKEPVSTSKEIWKILKEVSLGQKENREQMRETDRRMQKTDQQIQETTRQIRRLENMFSNKWGELVESLVSGAMLKMLRERNIEVTGILPNTKAQYKDSKGKIKECEIDILARNGQELVAIEVKSTLGVEKVKKFLEVLKHFTLFFPEYKDKKIYGAIAYLKVYQSADLYAMKQGLFVIKATGDSACITNTKNFKPVDFAQ